MVKTFNRDGHAYFRCVECGAEEIILKQDFTEGRPFATINQQKTMAGIDAFMTKHRLCKKTAKQIRIMDNNDLP